MSAFTYSAMGLSPSKGIGLVRCLPIVLDRTPSVLTADGVYFLRLNLFFLPKPDKMVLV